MRAAAAIVMLLSAAEAAGAQFPLAAEVRALADRYHEGPTGVMRSLFLLSEVKCGMETALELDPRFPPAYVLAGTERLFRTGLEVDGRFTGLRVGLARTLIKRGRIPEARRELQAALDEKAPSNPADWTLKDSPEAHRLLDALPGRS